MHSIEADVVFDGLDAEGRATMNARLPQVRLSLLEGRDIGDLRVHDCNGEVWLRFDLVKFGATIRGITQKADASVAGHIDGLSMIEQAYEGTEATSTADAQAEKDVLERLETFITQMNKGIEAVDLEILRPRGADIDNMAGDAFYIRVPPLNATESPAETLRRGVTIGILAQEMIEEKIGKKARGSIRFVEQDEIAFTASMGHLAFSVGEHWQKLYASESAATPGTLWMDTASAKYLRDADGLVPVEHKGTAYVEIDADLFRRADVVARDPITIPAEQTERAVELVAQQSRELPKAAEHRSVFITCTTIKGNLGTTKEAKLETTARIGSVLKSVEQETDLFFWKTDTSPGGDLVILGMHEGTNGHASGRSPAELVVRGLLAIQEELAPLNLVTESALGKGTMLRQLVGSPRRFIIDGMGPLVVDVVRQAQLRGVVVTASAEPSFTACNLEVGTPVLLPGAKEMPEGVRASLVTTDADLRPIEPIVEPTMGLLLEFEVGIRLWAEKNGLHRFDWSRIMEAVSRHVTGGDIVFSKVDRPNESEINKRLLLEDIAAQLRIDLRVGKSAKQIEQSLAAAAANSQEMQRVVDELKKQGFEDALYLLAVLLGGKNTAISEKTIHEIGRKINVQTQDCLDYLTFHRYIFVEDDGQIRLFAPLHRRIYESLSNENRQSRHAAIARYYRDLIIDTRSEKGIGDDIRRWLLAFVYHGYESHDQALLEDVRRAMPFVIKHFRELNDWASIRQHADWFLKICSPEEKAQGLLWKGEALVQLGEFVDAHACYRAILSMPKNAYPKLFPLQDVEIEEAYTRTFVETADPHQDPHIAQKNRQDAINEVLKDLDTIFDGVAGDTKKGIPAFSHAQAKALRRIGEIAARTEGVDRARVKARYADWARILFEENVRFAKEYPEAWATVAPMRYRLGGEISAVILAMRFLEGNYCPAYAEPLAALYLTLGRHLLSGRTSDIEISISAEAAIHRGLYYAQKSQNKPKMLEAMNNLGDLLVKTNQLEGVESLIDEALELSERVQHWYMKGATQELKGLLNLRIYLNIRDADGHDEADRYLVEALVHLRIARDHFLYNHAYGNEGIGMIRSDITEILGDAPIPPEVAEFLSQLPTLEALPT